MQMSRERSTRRIGALALIASISLAAPLARAKLDVPYGKDGSPPDSDTQAKVDALNDALDGPDEGQSEAQWEAELQAAHEALYGTGIVESTNTTSSSGGTGNTATSNTDLCDNRVDQWLEAGSDEPIAAALSDDATVRADLTTELQNFMFYMMQIQTAGSIARPARPTVSRLSCAAGDSEITATLPISLVELGLTLDHGSITVHASASYRERPVLDDWCLDIHRYDINGFEPLTLAMIKPRLDEAMSENPFCMPAFGRAYAVKH